MNLFEKLNKCRLIQKVRLLWAVELKHDYIYQDSLSSEQWADKKLVLFAVSKDGNALKYASDSLRSDKEVVIKAVSKDGYALEYASDSLRSDKEVVIKAIQKDVGAKKWALGAAINDSDVLAEEHKLTLSYVSKKSLGYPNLKYLSDEMLKDKEIILTAFQNGWSYYGVCDRVIMDEEIARVIAKTHCCKSKPMTAQEAHAQITDQAWRVNNHNENVRWEEDDSISLWLHSDERMLELICLLTANFLTLMEDPESLRDSMRTVENSLFNHFISSVQHIDDWELIFDEMNQVIAEYHLGDASSKAHEESDKLREYVIKWCTELANNVYYEYDDLTFRGIRTLLQYLSEDIAIAVLLNDSTGR